MKNAFFISAGTFIVTLMLSFSNEFRLFVVGLLGVVLVFSVLAGYVGFGWLREWQRIKKAERMLKEAEALKAKRDSEHTVVITHDNQTYIRETNHNAIWRAAHLDRRIYANGHDTEVSDQDNAAWLIWNCKSNPSQIPANIMGDSAQDMIIEQEAEVLPEKVDLQELIPSMRGNIRNIVLGMRIDNDGQQKVVSAPMFRLCHIGVAGATDSGKSNFGRCVAYQIATALDDTKLVISDLKGTTFKAFSNCPKLLYPISGTIEDFLAIMREIKGEMDKRKEQFKLYPTVEKLDDYNKISEKALPQIVVLIDEISNLFLFKETQQISLEMLREARAFGIYFLGMGQSWSHKEMSTSIRQQFRTGFHFGTNDPSSSRMMVQSSEASKITIQGRAIAALPFGMSQGPIEIQTPYIDNATVLEKLEQPLAIEDGLTSKQQQVIKLWNAGIKDKKTLVEMVYKSMGGAQYQMVEAALSKAGVM